MKNRSILIGLLWFSFAAVPLHAAAQSIDPALAVRYFSEAEAASKADNGKLWGVALYGPMFFVDPEDHVVVANQADAQGQLKHEGVVWTGKLPPEMAPANTAMDWLGTHWTMVMWPVDDFRQARLRLLMHELFHRIQPQIGLPVRDSLNNHLDSKDGRIYLQLEWRALDRALRESGPHRADSIADALFFRAWRRSLFPAAAVNENALEMNEGLAEYTGVKLSTESEAELREVAQLTLRQGHSRPTFVRSFAYVSGPAYGALLDEASPGWKHALKPETDLGELTRTAYGVPVPRLSEKELASRVRKYQGDDIVEVEAARAVQQARILADARQRLIENPVLVLPLGHDVQYSYDPNGVIALNDDMTVYPQMQITFTWGTLHVSKGVLMVRDKGRLVRAHVPAPVSADARKGDGWELELKPGWRMVAGPRPGDLTVAQAGNSR